MIVHWNYDGKTSNLVVEERDQSKVCTECGGYSGHFIDCKVFLKEKSEGKYD